MNKHQFGDEYYIYFVTSKTFRNYPYFNNRKNCLILLKVIDELRQKLGFKLFGYVIMPDHVHLMIEPKFIEVVDDADDADGMKPSAEPSAEQDMDNRSGDGFIPSPIQKIIHDIKGKSAFNIRNYLRIKDRIWQKSFYSIQIYSEKFYEQKLTYIHENPLKAGLVKDPKEYSWSSYQNIHLNNHLFIEIDYPEL